MSGGGTDAPPPNGGEFLLQLLRKPSQKSHAPPQSVSLDPAIAAVGPSTPTYPPFLHSHHNIINYNNNPIKFHPYNYFPQNPNINLTNDFSQFTNSHHQLHNDRINAGFTANKPGLDLVFGNFTQSNQITAKDSIFKQITPKDSIFNQTTGKDLIFNGPSVNSVRGNGENRMGQNGNHRIPGFLPGFTSKIGEGEGEGEGNGNGNGNGRWVFDHDVGKGKVGILNNRVDSGNVIKGMLDLSIAGKVIEEVKNNELEDIEQVRSLLTPKDESGEKNDTKKDDLGVEDESVETSDKKKNRDRDYRSDKRGKWIMAQRMRNQKSFTSFRSDINRLSAPFLALFESLIPSDEEKVKQKQLLTVLEKLVHKEWPEAQLYLYGSCGNSFGFSKSDIDLCLSMELGNGQKPEVLLKLAEIFLSENLHNVQALTRARVPIVKLMDPVTGISCDVCINNVLAVVNTKLLRDYAKIDSRLRQLVFLVKHWAKSRGVNETYHGTLSSYAYVLMCIHFLQQRRPAILPCLQGMEITYYEIVDGVECAYFDQVDKLCNFGSQNRESIAQLVWGFFHYWAYCHDYANDVISVRTGQTISKIAKDWTRRVGNDRHLICIEDPFEVSHDLGRVVDKSSIRVLREEFERAAYIMQYDPNPCVTLFEPYIPNKHLDH